ncbi:hypothetical protein B0T22DRAFT_438870 [Podospora appendiculata]|uniref:DUF7727 domain-containing protein n=1 Tax=Podospora appendiculata TaxID=314037 RepID=A0AAE0X6Y6_9PEZI|nr:hypothetical protein B0T22DRAFT_438870 [Podospora appendiculata]
MSAMVWVSQRVGLSDLSYFDSCKREGDILGSKAGTDGYNAAGHVDPDWEVYDADNNSFSSGRRLFTKPEAKYNTVPYKIQGDEAFHHDVSDAAHEANNIDDFYARLTLRRAERLQELQKAWDRIAIKIICSPAIFGDDLNHLTRWSTDLEKDTLAESEVTLTDSRRRALADVFPRIGYPTHRAPAALSETETVQESESGGGGTLQRVWETEQVRDISHGVMGRLIKNYWARLIMLTGGTCRWNPALAITRIQGANVTIDQVAAALEGFFWPKIFWDLLTTRLDLAVKPTPVLQSINLVFGLILLIWEWPLSFIAGSRLHRSIEARLAFLPLTALTAALTYQGTNAAIYQLIGLGHLHNAVDSAAVVCEERAAWRISITRLAKYCVATYGVTSRTMPFSVYLTLPV